MEYRKPYQVEGIAKEIRPETLKPFEEWTPPTAGEVRAAMQMAGLTGGRLAKRVGVSLRTVDRWTSGEGDIAYAAWALLACAAGFGHIWE